MGMIALGTPALRLGILGLRLGIGGDGAAAPPILQNLNSTISVVTAGYPAPPILTNTNGTITAEAA